MTTVDQWNRANGGIDVDIMAPRAGNEKWRRQIAATPPNKIAEQPKIGFYRRNSRLGDYFQKNVKHFVRQFAWLIIEETNFPTRRQNQLQENTMKRSIIASALACFALLAMTSVASAQFPFGGLIQRGGQAIRNGGQVIRNSGQVVRNTVTNRNGRVQNFNNNGFQQTGQWSQWQPVNNGTQNRANCNTQRTNGQPTGGFPQNNGPSGFPQGQFPSTTTGNGPSGFPGGGNGGGPSGFPTGGNTGNGPSGFPNNGPTGFPGGGNGGGPGGFTGGGNAGGQGGFPNNGPSGFPGGFPSP